jgi:hypothetical protein
MADPLSPPAVSPVIQAIASDANPVAASIWRSTLAPTLPRRSSRLVSANPSTYISIVDKVVQHKQKLNEGQELHPSRVGELDADALLVVDVEDPDSLPPRDVHVLAEACDIPVAALG